MITCVTYDNLEFTGKAFNAHFQLRHKCFLERQEYQVNSYNRKEYDQYDTPAAIYLVYHANGKALGASRLTPINHCCMINDLWPDMLEKKNLLTMPDVWEGTRFCIDKDLDGQLRRKISYELVLAYLEVGLQVGIKKIIGITPKLILKTVFKDSGVEFDHIGPSKDIDGTQVQAACMDITPQQLLRARTKTGINQSVLNDKELEFLLKERQQPEAA